MKKKLLLIVAAPLVLIVVAVLVLFLSLNGIVRRAVETNATASLKTPTTLGSAIVSPLGGSVSLSDLDIASPDGFSSPQMFTLGGISVDAHVGQLFGTPVRITSIKIDKPHLIVEQSGGKLNVLVLKEKTASPTAPTPATDNKPPMKLVIDQLELNDTSVTIMPGIPGVEKSYEVTLPSVSLTNIGNADGNASGEEIGQVVVDVATALASKAADSDKLPPQIRDLLHLNVGDIAKQLTDQAKQELQKQSGKLGVDLNDLMGGKKKKAK
ncbi:MAG: DUF748 domain-containing protein [Tepidisphaeraceae bacterium]